MAQLDPRAHAVLALGKELSQQIPAGHLEKTDETGCGEHAGGFRSQKINGRCAGYELLVDAVGAQGDLRHGVMISWVGGSPP